jgi:hypothetical protein
VISWAELATGSPPLVGGAPRTTRPSSTAAALLQADLHQAVQQEASFRGARAEWHPAYLNTHTARRAWIALMLRLRELPRRPLLHARNACLALFEQELPALQTMPPLY